MTRELTAQFATGATLYAVLRDASGYPWKASASGFDATPTAGEWANYAIAMAEDSTLGFYVGAFPASQAAGLYSYAVHKQTGGSPATTDPVVWTGEGYWTGTAWAVGLSAAAISAQVAADLATAHGAGAWGGQTGSGSVEWPYVVLDPDDNPIPDVFVWVTAANSALVLGSGYTDETGTVLFLLDPGTYWFRARKGGYNPAGAYDEEVVA